MRDDILETPEIDIQTTGQLFAIQNTVGSLRGVYDDNATAVLLIDFAGRYATGSSKRNNGEVRDQATALDLAYARALINLGTAILKQNGAKA